MPEKEIKINPVDMDEGIMSFLEEKGLIKRLLPGAFVEDAPFGSYIDVDVCISDAISGAHSVGCASYNIDYPEFFVSHSDHEEVYFIGAEDRKPLYVLFSLLLLDELNVKAADDTLCEDDFICLRVKFNDPMTSFFVINKDILHAEFIEPDCDKRPPTFYYSAGKSLTSFYPEMNGYVFRFVK